MRAFSAAPSLPLAESGSSEAGALLGRRRLAGAFLIEVGRIQPDPGQPRKNLDTQAQRELADSVCRFGILQPISVRYLEEEDVYQIISGERRFQAARSARLAEVPCWVQTPRGEEILLRQIAENWQRAELHPYDLADALATLRDAFGYTQKQLAELTAKPESEVSRLLSLLKLNPAVQRSARQDPTGAVTRRHLIALAQLPPEDQQEAMIAVRERHLTALDTEQLVKEKKALAKGAGARGTSRGQRFHYATSRATVTVAFRKRDALAAEVLAALDEARAQVQASATEETTR